MSVKNVNTERTYVNGKLVKGKEPYTTPKKKAVKKAVKKEAPKAKEAVKNKPIPEKN